MYMTKISSGEVLGLVWIFSKDGSDPNAREATTRITSLARAYSNLGVALAAQEECL